jgi:HEAT repeat protein
MKQRGDFDEHRLLACGIVLVCTALILIIAGCQRSAELHTIHGQSISHWLGELKKSDAKVRKKAVIALESVGNSDPGAIPAIIGELKDPDSTVRDAAVLALLNIGPDAHEATTALEALKNDKDATIRAHAAKAIDRIKANP